MLGTVLNTRNSVMSKKKRYDVKEESRQAGRERERGKLRDPNSK